METIRLSDDANYKKYKAIEKAGFKAVKESGKFVLIDTKAPEAESYIDTLFSSLNEILSVLAGYLMKVGILVVV